MTIHRPHPLSVASHQHSHALPVFLDLLSSATHKEQQNFILQETSKLGGSNLIVVHLVSVLDSQRTANWSSSWESQLLSLHISLHACNSTASHSQDIQSDTETKCLDRREQCYMYFTYGRGHYSMCTCTKVYRQTLTKIYGSYLIIIEVYKMHGQESIMRSNERQGRSMKRPRT